MIFIFDMNPINFTAQHIRNVFVDKKQDDKYRPVKASFVELDIYNKKDFNALKDINSLWGHTFVELLVDDAEDDKSNELPNKNLHFYAVTEQNDDFENLDSRKVLGLLEFDENYKDLRYGKIEIIQARPKHISSRNKDSEFNKVGSRMLDSLKFLYFRNPIVVHAVHDAIKFYEENGFVKSDDPTHAYEYFWIA